MTTALHMIKRAFSMAGIKPAETPLTASETNDGRDLMNDMLAAWDANGTLEGVPLVSDVNDTVDAPRYADWAIKANLSILIRHEYDIPVTQGAAFAASQSFAAMVNADVELFDIEFPDTLPIGSGNRDNYYSYVDDVFFPRNTKRNF